MALLCIIMSNFFFDRAYAARTADETRAFRDAWAATFDTEAAAAGYATPVRCAAALARFSDASTVLDFGCGTGLSGAALKQAGFACIDGADLSPDMLARAADKQIYRSLTQLDSEPHISGGYDAIAAVDIIGSSAAPMAVFDRLLRALNRGGKLVFSLDDRALADPVSISGMNEWLDCGAARLLFVEYGDHLPELQVKANVYVIEKA